MGKKGPFLGVTWLVAFCLLWISCAKSRDSEPAFRYDVPSGSENWPSFRGWHGAGLTEGQNLPLEWDVQSGKNIEWSYKTPGLGLSAPVIWGKRVFITTAVDQVADDADLKVGLYGNVESVENENSHTWEVICLDRDSGREVWRKEAFRGVPRIKRHPKSSHANSTVATDGKHVVAFFGSEGLYGYDFNGELLWTRDFGVLDSGWYTMPEAQWEFGSSPVIYSGVVVVQVDVQKNSFIAALDVKTGETLWKRDRDEIPTWSTPGIYEGMNRTQVVVNGYKHIGGYDFSTGEPIWWLKGGGDIPVPTPVFGFDHVYITSSHGRMRPLYAIKLTAEGDITPKGEDTPGPHISWYYARQGAYMPTPIVYGDYLYVCRNAGIIMCFDAKTGEELYKQRVGGMRTAFTASPVAADGKLYLADEFGDVHIVKAGPVYEYLGANPLSESCLSTPAISGGLLFVRTVGHLFAIGKGGETKGIETRTRLKARADEIDLSTVRTDGSISDPQELLRVVSAKLRTISAVEYDMTVQGIESQEVAFGRFTLKTRLQGDAVGYGWPEYFYVEGEYIKDESTAPESFAGSSDGNRFYYLEKSTNTLETGVELGDMGSGFRPVSMALITEFVSADPFSMEKSAEIQEIKGKKTINGEECYELDFAFPQNNNYEITWYISVRSFLPLARSYRYSLENGQTGGYIQTLSNIKLIQPKDPDSYKIEELNIR